MIRWKKKKTEKEEIFVKITQEDYNRKNPAYYHNEKCILGTALQRQLGLKSGGYHVNSKRVVIYKKPLLFGKRYKNYQISKEDDYKLYRAHNGPFEPFTVRLVEEES